MNHKHNYICCMFFHDTSLLFNLIIPNERFCNVINIQLTEFQNMKFLTKQTRTINNKKIKQKNSLVF